jgi:hypothetical protein
MSTIEKKAVKVGKYVNTEHVDNLIRNYKKDRWMQNSEKLGSAFALAYMARTHPGPEWKAGKQLL